MKRKNYKNLHLEHTADYICFSQLSNADKKNLEDMGYAPLSLPYEVYGIDCSSLNRVRHGIGIRNQNGGVEFINFDLMRSPTTIHRKGISKIKDSNNKSNTCCVFANFLDFMAFSTMRKETAKVFPCGTFDHIILNHPRNVISFLVESEFYDHIHLFLPNTVAGKCLARTIMSRKTSITDWSCLYSHYKSLHSLLSFKHKKSKK